MVSGRSLSAWMVVGLLAGCGPREHRGSGAADSGTAGAIDDVAGPGAGEGSGGSTSQPNEPDAPAIPGGAELAAEIARIAGRSFNVSSSEPDFHCDAHYWYDTEPFVATTLSFREDESGGLELIASTPGPWLRIERSRLKRGKAGWIVETPPPLGGCMGHDFEEEVNPYWAVPETVTLSFDAGASRLSLTAHFAAVLIKGSEREASDVVAMGEQDDVAPVLREPIRYRDTGNDTYYEELSLPWRLPRRFEFSEAMKPGWSVALEDDAGNRWPVAESDPGDELVTGFEVDRYFPDGFQWVVEGGDLAGNASATAPPWAGVKLQAQAADFEGELDLGLLCAGGYESYEFTKCEGGFERCSVETAEPIAGARSIAVDECQLFLRVPRVADATTLRFQARVELDEQFGRHGIAVDLRALDAGSPGGFEHHELATWTAEIEEITLPLPGGTADVLVAIRPESRVWLDSMRTE